MSESNWTFATQNCENKFLQALITKRAKLELEFFNKQKIRIEEMPGNIRKFWCPLHNAKECQSATCRIRTRTVHREKRLSLSPWVAITMA